LGDTKVEDVLKKLNNLTLEEARMTEAQILLVVDDFVSKVKSVIEGV
jgi:hypothetical protein